MGKVTIDAQEFSDLLKDWQREANEKYRMFRSNFGYEQLVDKAIRCITEHAEKGGVYEQAGV